MRGGDAAVVIAFRSYNRVVDGWPGKPFLLGPGEPGPFRNRRDADVRVAGIMDLMGMRSAGDLAIYGIDAPEGHVSYHREVGAPAGASPAELHTFLMASPGCRRPGPVTHPIYLYAHFLAYQEPT